MTLAITSRYNSVWRHLCWIACLCGCFPARLTAAEAAALRPIDLVGHDVAVVGELHRPQAAWGEFQQGELYRRFEQSELYRAVSLSDGFQKWQEMERGVAATTGTPLSSLLLDLCSQELVLAVYLSASNQPEGVLLTQAADAATVQRVLQAWQKLEPQSSSQTLKHQGQAYVRRSAVGPRKTAMYYATFGAVFALSDQESRIKQVIEFQQSELSRPANSAKHPNRLRDSAAYQRTTPISSQPAATARLLLLIDAWKHVLREASPSDPGAMLLRRFWPALDAFTVELRQEQGLHLEAKLHLNAEQTDELWKAWSASTPKPDDFLATVPAHAVAVAAGGIHFESLWAFLQNVVPNDEQAGWQKPRRVIQGFLGGRDLLDKVLPALSYQMGMYLVAAPKEHHIPLDGVIICRFPDDQRTAGLHVALDQAFSAGLTMLSIQVNEKHPDAEPATVRSEIAEQTMLRWLDTPLPISVAYRLTPEGMVVSRSIQTLRSHLAAESTKPSESAFTALRARWFADAGQFICVDVQRLREQLGSVLDPAPPVLAKPRHVDEDQSDVHLPRQLVRLCDAAYFATQFEPGLVSVRFGLVSEAPR